MFTATLFIVLQTQIANNTDLSRVERIYCIMFIQWNNRLLKQMNYSCRHQHEYISTTKFNRNKLNTKEQRLYQSISMNHIIWKFQSWVYNQRIESRSQKGIRIPIFITMLFETRVHQQNNNMWSIHAAEYSSAFKKKEILPYGITWMNLEAIILSEVSHSQKCKYYIILLI